MKYTNLVNKDNIFKENYLTKINLLKIKDINNNEIYIEEETYKAYLKLKEYLKNINISIVLTKALRTITEQEKLYNELLEEKGLEYVEKYLAMPMYSEHHTGLAIDIAININDKIISEENELTKSIYEKIHKHLYKFGFILRYPKEKEKITGYNYKSYHIRYVGIIPAKIIYENNLTLEEYLKDFGTILYINKPKDITSFDVVSKISKLFGIKRVGHTGTLDPLATGVLLVAVGKATKIVELLTANDKEYIAEVKLGIKTDTYDITGNILEKKEIPKNINLKEVLRSFKKTYLQEVPIYSAVKVAGKKLYDYARKNENVTLPKKEVTIKEIELLENNDDIFKFKSKVTKGCYIRSLINDIGECLNTYATMTSLERTRQGLVSIEETNTLEEIENNNFKLHNIIDVLPYKVIEIDSTLEKKIANGVKIKDEWNIKEKIIFKNNQNILIGIYEKDGEYLKTWKNFI